MPVGSLLTTLLGPSEGPLRSSLVEKVYDRIGGEQTDCFVVQDPSVRALEPVGCTDYLRRAAHDIPHIASWP